jgi:hypothetical protein
MDYYSYAAEMLVMVKYDFQSGNKLYWKEEKRGRSIKWQ